MAGRQPKRGEIWTINLDPTVGSEIRKTRPAVVVSAPVFDALDVRIVVPITTWQDRFSAHRNKVRLLRSGENLLDHDSAADFLQVRCVSTQRFVARVGELESALLEEVVAGIAIAVDYRP